MWGQFPDEVTALQKQSSPSLDALRTGLSTPVACIAVACAAMLLAGLEHGYAPWRPFYVSYAALCIAIPLFVGGRFNWVRLGASRWLLLIALVIAVQAGLAWFAGSGLPGLLSAFGVGADAVPDWNPSRALGLAIARYAPHWGFEPPQMLLAYLMFITVWAGVGEELFYRGYVQERLRPWGTMAAVLVSAFLFAIRHAVQLQGPDYPWRAALVWVALCFVLGLMFAALYEWKRSIWPPIVAHVLFNLIPASQLLAARFG